MRQAPRAEFRMFCLFCLLDGRPLALSLSRCQLYLRRSGRYHCPGKSSSLLRLLALNLGHSHSWLHHGALELTRRRPLREIRMRRSCRSQTRLDRFVQISTVRRPVNGPRRDGPSSLHDRVGCNRRNGLDLAWRVGRDRCTRVRGRRAYLRSYRRIQRFEACCSTGLRAANFRRIDWRRLQPRRAKERSAEMTFGCGQGH